MMSRQSKNHTGKALLGLWTLLILSAPAHSGYFEASAGFSYTRSNYSDDNYNWTRRIGLNIGYHFTDQTELEFGFQDVLDRTHIVNYEDTTFHDQIFSLNVVQSLLPKSAPVQPFVKGGVGQLNREATGVYAGGASPPKRVDSVTVILGAGVRIYLTRTFAIRSEVTSYLRGAQIRKWKDDMGVTIGISYLF